MPILHEWSNKLGDFDTSVRFDGHDEWDAEFVLYNLIVARGQGKTQEESIKDLLAEMSKFQDEINKSIENLKLILSLG